VLPIRSQAAEFFPSSVAVKIDQKVLFVDQCNEAPLLIDILQRSIEGHAFHSAAVAWLHRQRPAVSTHPVGGATSVREKS